MRHAVLLRLVGFVLIAFLTSGAIPDNGIPDNGVPDNGLPDNGIPDNGLPDNGNSPDALVNSVLFYDAPTHAYWVGHPFTAATINDPAHPSNPLRVAIADPFSAMVMAYQWQLCHPQGDDATVLDVFGRPHTFHGRVGLCALPGGHGWHLDQPLDFDTARYLSSSTITQVNRFQVHNRYSLRGPTSDLSLPGGRGNQLTSMAASMTSYLYRFGTHQPVEALGACPSFSSGLDPCGWKPHFVGLGQPGSTVRISAVSNGVPMILQVNLGIYAANPGEPAALAVSGPTGTVDPNVQFIVPPGGTFNVQWAVDPRPLSTSLPASIAPPTLSAAAIQGGGTLRFPADEVFVFPNREMYATAMIFNLSSGDSNIAPIPGVTVPGGEPVANCAPRINSDGFVEFCDASTPDACTPCRRTTIVDAGFVAFPNSHVWLDSAWTNAQDYYRLRSCNSDQSVCVASLEGFIDASYCGPADPHCLLPGSTVVSRRCKVQSLDRDTANPHPYPGNGKKLNDAFQCHIGSGADTGYGVTTFFANYGTQGPCWATTPGNPACQYVAPSGDPGDQ